MRLALVAVLALGAFAASAHAQSAFVGLLTQPAVNATPIVEVSPISAWGMWAAAGGLECSFSALPFVRAAAAIVTLSCQLIAALVHVIDPWPVGAWQLGQLMMTAG